MTDRPRFNTFDPPLRPDLIENAEPGQTSLLELLKVLADSKWLIIGLVLMAAGAGAGYAYLATPVYQANTLIQVDEGKPSPNHAAGVLGQASDMFEVRSSVSAETHILRSRMIVGQAVDKLGLTLSVEPKYLPLVGAGLARHASAPSEPGPLGLAGYVHGNEFLEVTSFVVPREFEGRRFTVTLTDSGYELQSPDGRPLGQGRFGALQEFAWGQGQVRIAVASAHGKPGAQFHVERRPKLKVVEELQRAIAIELEGTEAGVIRSSLTGPDPEKVALVLNEIGSLYVQQNLTRKSAEAEKTLASLASVLPDLRSQVEQAEARFNQFRNRHGTFDLTAESKAAIERSVQVQAELSKLEQSRRDLEATLGPQHPNLMALDARIRSLSGEMRSMGNRMRGLPGVEQDLLRLSRDLKVKTEMYSSLLTASQQLQLVKEGKVGNARLIDSAVAPSDPVKPQFASVVAFSSALGLVLGVLLAFFRNGLRKGINNPAQVEAEAGMQLLSTVPQTNAQATLSRRRRRHQGARVLAVREPQDAAVESLRGMRAAVQFAMRGAQSQVILITGPTPGVGKSFTSTNLAAVLGAANRRVLLIDADLRKGQLNECFHQPREPGLSEVLTGEAEFDQAVRRSVLLNVDLLTTGTMPGSPADLLSAGPVKPLLDRLSTQYDLIILDAPAVLVAADAAVLAPLAGAVFLVARANATTVGELQETGRRLATSGVQPRGVILNGMSARDLRYGVGTPYGRYVLPG